MIEMTLLRKEHLPSIFKNKGQFHQKLEFTFFLKVGQEVSLVYGEKYLINDSYLGN